MLKDLLTRIVIILIIVGIAFLICRAYQIEEAGKEVKGVCITLDSQIGEDGLYIRESKVIKDYWDNPLNITYSPFNEEEMVEYITVVSAGWDEKFGTRDDISYTKTNLVPANLYRGFQNATRETAGNATRGVIDGILNYKD